jgi:hypothetical protein
MERQAGTRTIVRCECSISLIVGLLCSLLKWTVNFPPKIACLTPSLLLCLLITGLTSHPQHELAKRQCTGCPGMISFYIKGTLQHAETFLKNLKVTFPNRFLNCRGKTSLHSFIISHFRFCACRP